MYIFYLFLIKKYIEIIILKINVFLYWDYVLHLFIKMFKNLFKKDVITKDIALKYVNREIESVYYYKSITLEWAKILWASNLKVLWLHFIKKIDVDIAKELGKFRWDRLDLRSLESIDYESAYELWRFYGTLDIWDKSVKKMVDAARNERLKKALDDTEEFRSNDSYVKWLNDFYW
jgi:hypothetical protein